MRKAMRFTGWTLIAFGAVVLLYLVYLMFFTNLTTGRAQNELLEQWELNYGELDQALPGESFDVEAERSTPQPVDPGDAYAVLWFERPGAREPLVHEDPLYVVEGVGLDVLRRGPGHYPESDGPGGHGNFAISGHRTTYGAPFYHLDDLQPGDRVHVVDRSRRQWTYEVVEQTVVGPQDVWVVGADPLEAGKPTLTLTTCHPRFSADQRLVVFAHLTSV